MAAYRRVYDLRHLQTDCMPRTGISSGTLRSAIEYGLPLPFTRLENRTIGTPPLARIMCHKIARRLSRCCSNNRLRVR